MTRQPTPHIGVFPSMALDTFPHAPVLIGQPVQVLDLSVAFPTGNLGVDMALMIEQHMLGDIIQLDPGGRRLGVEIAVFDLNPRVLDNDVIMTIQTLFHRRDARKS